MLWTRKNLGGRPSASLPSLHCRLWQCRRGRKEGQGPLGRCFDFASQDDSFAEKAGRKQRRQCRSRPFPYALDKAGISSDQLDYVFAGRPAESVHCHLLLPPGTERPFFRPIRRLLHHGGRDVSGGHAGGRRLCFLRSGSDLLPFLLGGAPVPQPLEYGGQKPPTAQWTTTGSGAVILSRKGTGPFITHVTTGKVVDKGVTDANNMGAAMAPAAYATLHAHFEETGRSPDFL